MLGFVPRKHDDRDTDYVTAREHQLIETSTAVPSKGQSAVLQHVCSFKSLILAHAQLFSLLILQKKKRKEKKNTRAFFVCTTHLGGKYNLHYLRRKLHVCEYWGSCTGRNFKGLHVIDQRVSASHEPVFVLCKRNFRTIVSSPIIVRSLFRI